MRATLVSTYDLGHQPFGLASAAAWLEAEGWVVALLDLAVQGLDEGALRGADLIGFYLPMHTATRLATPLIRRSRALNPEARLCAFGLYAPFNRDLLRRLGVNNFIGGEFEEPLLRLARQVAGANTDEAESLLSVTKQRFMRPARTGLPPLSRYAYLQMPDGTRRQVGSTEATRGCKHHCRHCPIVPVYDGRFFVVQREVVLEDIRQQVSAGATHICFGDPDFFNGVGHAIGLVRQLHQEFPTLTYDVTIKIEHLIKHRDALPILRDTGCLFVTSAVETVDDRILSLLRKGHTRADFIRAVGIFKELGLTLSPTFVAFSPWLSLDGYRELLDTLAGLGLVENVGPVQLAIRLLIPAGSRLLELPEVCEIVGEYDEEALCYQWRHPDPRMDALHAELNALVQRAAATGSTRSEIFEEICAQVDRFSGRVTVSWGAAAEPVRRPPAIPQMSEPWYCCAEPTARQMDAY